MMESNSDLPDWVANLPPTSRLSSDGESEDCLALGAGVSENSATGSDMYALGRGIEADHPVYVAVHAGPRSDPELHAYGNGPDLEDVEMLSVGDVPGARPSGVTGLKMKKLTRAWHHVTNGNMMAQTRTEAFLFQNQTQPCNVSTPAVTLDSQPTSLAPVQVLCHLCNVSPALVRCETCQKVCAPLEAFHLCAECDARNHITNPLHQRYAQVALTWVPLLATERMLSSTHAPIHMASHMLLNRTCPDCGSAIHWLVEDVTNDVTLTVICLDGAWDVHCATFVCHHPSLSHADSTGILVGTTMQASYACTCAVIAGRQYPDRW